MRSQTLWLCLVFALTLCVACELDTASDGMAVRSETQSDAATGVAANAVAGQRAEIVAGSGGAKAPAMQGSAGITSGSAGSTAAVGSAGHGAPTAAAGTVSTAGGSAAGAGTGTKPPSHTGAAAAGSGTASAASGGYAPCPENEVCRILPLGDSITYGIGYDGGYRVELFHKAHADGKRITFKTNDVAQSDDLTNAPKCLGGLIVHPDQKGYERMAAVWYEAIASLLH